MSGLPLNLDYIKTKPGMFKAISVAVGLLALAFTAATYDQAWYYNLNCYKYRDYLLSKSGRPIILSNEKIECTKEDKEMARWASAEHCASLRKQYVDFEETEAAAKLTDEEKKLYALGQSRRLPIKPCPARHMVILPMVIIIMAWLASLIFLVVMLVMDLNQKLPTFAKIDFIGHACAAGFLGISGLSMAGFLVWVFLSNFPCSQSDYDEALELVKKYSPSLAKGLKAEECKLEKKDEVYKIWLLCIGTILTIGAAVVYLLTAMKLKSPGPAGRVAPMMMPPGGQQQPPLTPSQAEAPPPGGQEPVQPAASTEAHHHHHHSKKSLKQ